MTRMTRKKNWAWLIVHVLMSFLVAIGGVSPIAYADSKDITSKSIPLWGLPKTNPPARKGSRKIPKRAPLKKNDPHSTLLQINQSLWLMNSSQQRPAPPPAVFQKLKVYQPGQKLAVYQPLKNPRQSMNSTYFNINHNTVNKAGIPIQLIPVYQAAGKTYGIPWMALAAIHRIETDFSTQPLVSAAGAEGPMQFMPSTFARYAVTAPECHGEPNINNVYDAIYTTAHMLAAAGYAKNPVEALYQYNHSMLYVESVRTLVASYRL